MWLIKNTAVTSSQIRPFRKAVGLEIRYSSYVVAVARKLTSGALVAILTYQRQIGGLNNMEDLNLSPKVLLSVLKDDVEKYLRDFAGLKICAEEEFLQTDLSVQLAFGGKLFEQHVMINHRFIQSKQMGIDLLRLSIQKVMNTIIQEFMNMSHIATWFKKCKEKNPLIAKALVQSLQNIMEEKS